MRKRKVKTLIVSAVLASMMLTGPQSVLSASAAEQKPLYYRFCATCHWAMPVYTQGLSDEEFTVFKKHMAEHVMKGEPSQFYNISVEDYEADATETTEPSTDTSSTSDNTKPSTDTGQTSNSTKPSTDKKNETVTVGTTTLRGKNITYNSATLTWDKVSGATKYEIQYKKSGGNWKRLTTTTGTSYTHKNLKTGGVYWYRVRAVKNTTNGKWSNTVSVKTSLDNVQNLKAKAVSGKKVSLTWKKVSGAKQYVVLRSTSKNGKYKVVGKVSKASYTDKGLKGGKKYYYKVYAVSGSCKTKETKPVTVKTGKK